MASLVGFSLVVFAVAFLGSRFKPGPWHAALVKPAWNPPNWVFAPVWTGLYACIAVAGWLTWRFNGGGWSSALVFWALQLVTNGLWTWLFFGRHRTGLAFADIVATLALIVAFIIAAQADTPVAAMLFWPYAAWVAFAALLNAAIWKLNPSPTTCTVPNARRRPTRVAPPPI